MQYMLLLYGNETRESQMTPEQMGKMLGAYNAYTNALLAAGVWLGGNALHPTGSGTTVRGHNVTDGPYSETKEQLGGYYLIDVSDLDAALGWAKRCPAAEMGSVEVRPVMVFTAEQLAAAG